MLLKRESIFLKFNHIIFLLLLLTAFYFYTNDFNSQTMKFKVVEQELNPKQRCDFFSGKWVFDESYRTVYEETKCPFMEGGFSCQAFGRKNLKYLHWRWKPNSCDLPRFNGKSLLEKLRGKKLVFVGDSLNRNQWISLLCMMDSSFSTSSNKTIQSHGNLVFFHDKEYNATIGFYWSPFLVESNCDNPKKHRVDGRVIRINAIDGHARHWNDVDYLIFDTHTWWLNPTITIMWGPFDSSDAIYKTVEMKRRRYEMALNTWSEWLEIHTNRTKTKLFFMGPSPFIFNSRCYNRTEPHFVESMWKNHDLTTSLQSAIQRLEKQGVKVELLRITELSEYRVDAHPSIFREFIGGDRNRFIDCLHWCLPGVPDVWNQILYDYIVKS